MQYFNKTNLNNLFLGRKRMCRSMTRDDFLRYSQEITLDPNTAQMNLLLSEGNRKVTLMEQSQFYPDHPERLSVKFQVLSKQSLSRRCYWEVQWGGQGGRGSYVAVAYKDVYKTDSVFGQNDTSWSLFCCPNNHQFWYNSIRTPIPGSEFSRVGVYLDQPAGTLSFYNVSESMILIHRVQTSFTQPLYAGIQLWFMGNSLTHLGLHQSRKSIAKK
uniref:B30.2/SPRY domain-containing protein n=1 Tax=Poecilia latipinna TaxID=48699 RepID=A0A3B3TSA2_9TELE